MISVKNVTLCAVAWGKPFVKKTINAFNSFKNEIKFEKVIFFLDDLNYDIPDNVSVIKLPKYFFDQSTLAMKIIGPIHSLSMNPYCKFVIKDIYKYVVTKHLLLFQHDGWIKNPAAWDDSWLEYDYIGAPWLLPDKSWGVGNGGFSLRSLKLCRILGTDDAVVPGTPEDWLICVTMRSFLESRHGIRFAPFPVANKFSVEYGFSYVDQFGFHGKWHI